MHDPTNYPLAWPTGYPRTKSSRPALFRSGSSGLRKLSVADSVARVERQIDAFTRGRQNSRTGNLVISTNIQPTLSGRPRSNQGEPADPGVAVYFTLDGKPKVFCCDRWSRVADNLAAIANTIEALRGIERWGVAEDERVFAGFAALPDSGDVQAQTCWKILGIPPTSTEASINAAWKEKAKTAHPDVGGSQEAMAELNNARDQAVASLQPR